MNPDGHLRSLHQHIYKRTCNTCNPFWICFILLIPKLLLQQSCISFCPEDGDSAIFNSNEPEKNRSSTCVMIYFPFILNKIHYPEPVFSSHAVRVKRKTHHPSQNPSRGVGRLQLTGVWSFFAAFGSVVPAGLSCQVDREVKRWRDNTGWQTTSVSDVQTCDPKCYMITPERITWLSRHWNLDFWIWEFKDVGYKRVCWPAVSSLWRLVSFFLCFPLRARIPSLQWLTPRSGF